jgi:serine/threonine-protein kinase
VAVFHRLRERKLFQWGVAYLAGAWVVFQVVDGVGEQFDWPVLLLRSITMLLGIGFFVALVLAWYHGEKGRQRVSSVEVFMLAALLVIAGSVLAIVRRGAEPSTQTSDPVLSDALSPIDERSIAVLPFTVRSAREEDVYFAGGMHDDLLAQLAKIDSLTVISRTSMMQYAETTKSVRQIAEELRVATVLEGSVQRSQERVRLAVQLIDARKDEHLWAETYDETLSTANIFDIQTDLARKIAGTLRAQLTPEIEARFGAKPTESLEAYEHWATGLSLWESQSSKDQLAAAAEHFQGAIDADSTYALAWVHLAQVHYLETYLGYRPASETFPLRKAAVDKALTLDPKLASAHGHLGFLLASEGRYEEAEAVILRALNLSPGLAITHRSYSGILENMGRLDEALAEVRRAVELDPLSVINRGRLVWSLLSNREWDAAISQGHEALELDSGNARIHRYLGFAHSHKGDHEKAIKALEEAQKLNPDSFYNTTGLAWAHARAGNRDEAVEWLDRIPDDLLGSFFPEIAIVYGEMGDLDRAYGYLERVAQDDPLTLSALLGDPTADSLRADPRYEPLMRGVGLEP